MQKPSLGRIVLIPADPTRNNGSSDAVAIITRVFGDTCINVRVLYDGNEVEWKTSMRLFADRDALYAARAERDEASPHMVGTPYFGAYWPPKV